MCNDNRHYTATAVNALQQAAANIEAERRRQHRAEFAQELRDRFTAMRKSGLVMMYVKDVVVVIDQLSPPVVCDSE